MKLGVVCLGGERPQLPGIWTAFFQELNAAGEDRVLPSLTYTQTSLYHDIPSREKEGPPALRLSSSSTQLFTYYTTWAVFCPARGNETRPSRGAIYGDAPAAQFQHGPF